MLSWIKNLPSKQAALDGRPLVRQPGAVRILARSLKSLAEKFGKAFYFI
ncbi:hypothetical protein [Persicitalea sp.]